ncbi:heterokaryon incompatibility protein-domain-containing protein [Hyaloscypha finlandica]|nr:heterokaryon incompatibility protein-domain-containing protein [Hyaloscypha finlandica]
MTQYQYAPLPSDIQQKAATTNIFQRIKQLTTSRPSKLKKLRPIRLLTILPGHHDDEIMVSLHQTSLDARPTPSYEALSYVWGSPKDPETIFITGSNELWDIQVTRNLAVALRHLCYTDKPRVTWIDAVCIDQSNLDERSSQVQLMGDIYGLAPSGVIVWLGPEEGESKYGMQLLEQLSSKVEIVEPGTFVPSAQSQHDGTWADTNQPLPYQGRELFALGCIINRPWFTRVWIRQEIFLASDNALVLCGDCTMTWNNFCKAVRCVFAKNTPAVLRQFPIQTRWFKENENSLARICELARKTPFTYKRLRKAQGYSDCKDPRDRIYAVLSMVYAPEQQLGIVPDYTLSILQVYRDVVRRFVGMGDLDLLAECRPTDSSWISWVPNWSQFSRSDSLQYTFLTGGPFLAVSRNLNNDDILSISGVRIDRVSKVFDLHNLIDYNYGSFIKMIRTLIPSDYAQMNYATGGSAIEAFVRTLVTEQLEEICHPPALGPPKLLDGIQTIRKIIAPGNEAIQYHDFDDGEKKFISFVNTTMEDKTFFFTSSSPPLMGAGIQSLQPGDLVCAFLGCERPLLLRPIENSKYRVLGPAYLRGYMHGQAFLGPITAPFRAVTTFVPQSGGDVFGFLDTGTGRFQIEDPRIDVLPLDWRDYKKYCKQGLRPLRTVAPEVFESVGVKMEWFDIV